MNGCGHDPALRAVHMIMKGGGVLRRGLILVLILAVATAGVGAADYIRWVDFDVSYEALDKALALDIRSQEVDRPVSWITLLAVAACRTGGKVTASSVSQAYRDLLTGKSPQELLGGLSKYYDYYLEAYTAVLGGLVGNYAILVEQDGEQVWQAQYGLKAFSPVAAGYGYSHCDDFGMGRTYGFARKHLGNDLMGGLGTPIVAVEGGRVEALGWNQYGGWRVGIRSHDTKRYYYYAHLQKDTPFAPGLQEGDTVQAGQVIGFMGRTGYSTKENVNNIETVHLHFGIQLIFDESQKECNSEIWIDAYPIVHLLNRHRSSVAKQSDGTWQRIYAYKDLDQFNEP